MLDPTLRATREERLGELALARTLEASPTQTIKPSAAASAASESPTDTPTRNAGRTIVRRRER